MKKSNISRLVLYDQANRSHTSMSYFDRLPTTLYYPAATYQHLVIFLETIQREHITPIDIQTWQTLQLFLVEPSWLQDKKRKAIQLSVLEHIEKHPTFVANILQQYHNISIFSDTISKQESLFFTLCALIRIATNTSGQHSIVQYKNRFLDCIQQSPNKWTPLIKGADWLINELQEDSGPLFEFLNQLALTITKSKPPADIVQQAMEQWIEKESSASLHTLDKSLDNLNSLFQDTFKNLENKKPTPRK